MVDCVEDVGDAVSKYEVSPIMNTTAIAYPVHMISDEPLAVFLFLENLRSVER
jgi:hypothetical protein